MFVMAFKQITFKYRKNILISNFIYKINELYVYYYTRGVSL